MLQFNRKYRSHVWGFCSVAKLISQPRDLQRQGALTMKLLLFLLLAVGFTEKKERTTGLQAVKHHFPQN